MILYACRRKTFGPRPTRRIPILGQVATVIHPCTKAGAALDAAGYEYELKRVDGYRGSPWTWGRRKQDRAEVRRLSGTDEVPILVLDDGEVISGSSRIVRWAKENPYPSARVSANRAQDLLRGDLRVRDAKAGDAADIAAVHVRSWQAAYRGILSDELLDGLSASEREASWAAILEDREERWLALVAARDDGALMGFCSVATPSQGDDTDERTAEVGALYVDPNQWRQGAGGAMLKTALEELSMRRYRDVILWVLPENRVALAFYDQFGFEIEKGVEKREERSGHRVIRLRASLPQASSS